MAWERQSGSCQLPPLRETDDNTHWPWKVLRGPANHAMLTAAELLPGCTHIFLTRRPNKGIGISCRLSICYDISLNTFLGSGWSHPILLMRHVEVK